MNPANRVKLLLENYVEARLAGDLSGYDIRQVDPENYEHYYILIQPKTGIYKGHSYILEMKTTYGHGSDVTTYPINPPYAHFVTDVFHTNISASGGSICVDILKQKAKWSPSYSFDAIVQNILMLFGEPNNDSPYNGEASRMWVDCEKTFKERKKGCKLSFGDEESLFEECFMNFKTTATQFAKKNNLSQYARWFPQLLKDESKQKTAMLEAKSELDELSTMLAQMKLKKKKKTSESVVATPTVASPTVASPTVTSPTVTSSTVTSSTVESTPVEDKKAKPNRWAKYKKNV